MFRKPKGIKVLLTYGLPGSTTQNWSEVSITRYFPAVPNVHDRLWLNGVDLFPTQARVIDVIWQVSDVGDPIPELILADWPIKTEVE